nr:cbb3-type cytochrome oxidase assembly protein CcoS [Rhizobium leguminosarum]
MGGIGPGIPLVAKSGQYDDLQGAARRILAEDETDQREP